MGGEEEDKSTTCTPVLDWRFRRSAICFVLTSHVSRGYSEDLLLCNEKTKFSMVTLY